MTTASHFRCATRTSGCVGVGSLLLARSGIRLRSIQPHPYTAAEDGGLMAEATDGGRASLASWREVFRGRRGRLTIGLLILEAMVGVEALVVTTILLAVERDLGGLRYYGWAFSAFGLATLTTVSLGGRATD